MIVVVGLVLLVAAVVVGLAGVLGNAGSAHALHDGFSAFGYHVTGSTGTLFLYGMVVGAAALLGLSLLLTGARHTSRRGQESRRELARSRRETAAVSQDRDDLIAQRDTARADASSHTVTGEGRSRSGGRDRHDASARGVGARGPIMGRLFGHRPIPAKTVATAAPTAGKSTHRWIGHEKDSRDEYR